MNYITYNQLINDSRNLSRKIKNHYAGIISIPRSGNTPANIIALHFNIPVYTIMEFLNKLNSLAFTQRITTQAKGNTFLVVDDSCNTGERIHQCKQQLAHFIDYNFEYACIYVTESSRSHVNYYSQVVAQPRVFEWNIFNHSILSQSCLDIDGVVCPDPPAGMIDEVIDEQQYINFISTADPINIINVPIKCFVTSRLEKYRQITEEWLKRHGFNYGALYMCPYTDALERRKRNCYADDKADVYMQTNGSLMIESSESQAQKIHLLTGKPVFCVDSNEMYSKMPPEPPIKKLEIGPGEKSLGPDWIAMDMIQRPHVHILHDVRKIPFPVDSDTFDVVYMSHILEHIPWFQTVDFLREIHRILKPGGTVEIWVPDLKKLVAAYLQPELVKNDGWYRYNPDKHPTTWFNGRLFTYGPGEENWHRAAFDSDYLELNMKKAGLRNIQKLDKPRGYDHGWINLGMSGMK